MLFNKASFLLFLTVGTGVIIFQQTGNILFDFRIKLLPQSLRRLVFSGGIKQIIQYFKRIFARQQLLFGHLVGQRLNNGIAKRFLRRIAAFFFFYSFLSVYLRWNRANS